MAILFPGLLLLAGCPSSNTATGPTSGVWTQVTAHAPFAGRYGLAGTVFNNQMWVLGGASGDASGSVTNYYPDVWNSSNGSNWTSPNPSGPFGGRYGSQLLSYNGSLWLIGGNSGGVLKNDVWNSSDGVTWTQVLASTLAGGPNQFTPREDFGAVVFNNAMWVIGGWDSKSKNKNDVWSSTDGITWNQATAAAPFAGRWGMATVVFNNMIWVMLGASGTTSSSDPTMGYDDVWSSANGSAWNLVGSGALTRTYYDQAVSTGSDIFLTVGYLWNNWGPQSGSVQSADGVNWTLGNTSYQARFGHLSLFYGNKVWVIAGCNNVCSSTPCPTTVTYFNDVWSNP